MLQTSCIDFAVEHRFGCHVTEPGCAGDIGVIEIIKLLLFKNLIDWLIDPENFTTLHQCLFGIIILRPLQTSVTDLRKHRTMKGGGLYQSTNQSNFYSANIPAKAGLKGATAESVFNSKIDETVP